MLANNITFEEEEAVQQELLELEQQEVIYASPFTRSRCSLLFSSRRPRSLCTYQTLQIMFLVFAKVRITFFIP
jgi:hypothetical protein